MAQEMKQERGGPIRHSEQGECQCPWLAGSQIGSVRVREISRLACPFAVPQQVAAVGSAVRRPKTARQRNLGQHYSGITQTFNGV